MSEVLPTIITLKVRGSFSWINDFADIPDHLSGGLFLKGNVVQELLDFISKECQIKLGENLHWARRERLLSIENVAQKAGCSVEDIDALETGRKRHHHTLQCNL